MASTLLQWDANGRQVPAASGGDDGERGTNPIPFHGLGNGESAHFTAVMPKQFDAGASLVVRLHVAFTANAGNMEFETAIDRIGTGQQDIDSESYDGAINSGDVAVPATSGHVAVVENTHTTGDVDGVQPGELFRLKVTRTTPSTNEATGDAQIIAVDIEQA